MADQLDIIAQATPPRASVLAPFRHRIFLAIWVASLVSNFGQLIQSVGASWLMTSLAPSANMIALVQAATTLPIMLFSLAAGAVADNYDRRLMMIGAQLVMLSVSAALAVFAWLHLLTPWTLLGLTFLLGCGAALNQPAWQASVGEQVPRADLPSAVALNGLGYNIARSVGPAIGGAIVALAGAAAAFAINAATYIGLIAVLARWRPPVAERLLPREALGGAMVAGLRYAAMSPAICVVLLRGSTFGFAGAAIWALMPVIARDAVGGGPLTYGLLLGSFGLGAVAGAAGSARLRARVGNVAIVQGSTLAFALAAVVVALSGDLALTMAALLLAGGGWVLALSTFNVTVQMSAPRWVVARMLAIYQTLTFGGLALGSWVWGELATSHGLRIALLASAGAMAAAGLLGLRFRLSEPAAMNLDPSRAWAEPQVRIDMEPRSGPVVVTVEYRVDPEQAAGFVAAMAERRRIRRRDGARDWTLLQDVADPAVWIEEFRSPTWVEHMRTHHRVTYADAAIEERVRAFHHGHAPVVRHMLERPAGAMPNLMRMLRGEPLRETITDPTTSP